MNNVGDHKVGGNSKFNRRNCLYSFQLRLSSSLPHKFVGPQRIKHLQNMSRENQNPTTSLPCWLDMFCQWRSSQQFESSQPDYGLQDRTEMDHTQGSYAITHMKKYFKCGNFRAFHEHFAAGQESKVVQQSRPDSYYRCCCCCQTSLTRRV